MEGQGRSGNFLKKQKKKNQNMNIFFLFIGLIVLTFYLWGKVQIDFDHRRNQGLIQDRKKLEEDIKRLRVQIHFLESYQRITDQASKQGMVFLSPDQIQILPVDLNGIKTPDGMDREQFRYASLFPNRLK